MTDSTRSQDADNGRIILSLLESVERDGGQSQRLLASDLGIALGLVNAYLKRCIKKGLVKVGEAPARRYMYYLTPQGFAEKSRLTVEYLSRSFEFFRRAKADCHTLLQRASGLGYKRIVLAGRSDLAEIAIICAIERGIEVVAIVDAETEKPRHVGCPIVPSFDAIEQPYDAIMITDLVSTRATIEQALVQCQSTQVLVPQLLVSAGTGLSA